MNCCNICTYVLYEVLAQVWSLYVHSSSFCNNIEHCAVVAAFTQSHITYMAIHLLTFTVRTFTYSLLPAFTALQLTWSLGVAVLYLSASISKQSSWPSGFATGFTPLGVSGLIPGDPAQKIRQAFHALYSGDPGVIWAINLSHAFTFRYCCGLIPATKIKLFMLPTV